MVMWAQVLSVQRGPGQRGCGGGGGDLGHWLVVLLLMVPDLLVTDKFSAVAYTMPPSITCICVLL